MSLNGCGGGLCAEKISDWTSQNGMSWKAVWVGVAAARIGASRSVSSADGPTYCPRKNAEIGSRESSDSIGVARTDAAALNAAGAVAQTRLNSANMAPAASAPVKS